MHSYMVDNLLCQPHLYLPPYICFSGGLSAWEGLVSHIYVNRHLKAPNAEYEAFFLMFYVISFQSICSLGLYFLLVGMSFCLSIRVFVCSLLSYSLHIFLPPLAKVGCPKFLEIWNPWGKSNGKKWYQI